MSSRVSQQSAHRSISVARVSNSTLTGSLHIAGVRAIISKGWSDRLSKETDEEVKFPPECFSVSTPFARAPAASLTHLPLRF